MNCNVSNFRPFLDPFFPMKKKMKISLSQKLMGAITDLKRSFVQYATSFRCPKWSFDMFDMKG